VSNYGWRIGGKESDVRFNGIDLVSSDGGKDMKEAIDGQAMLRKVEGRKCFDLSNDGLGHVASVKQHLVDHGDWQGLHVFANAREQGQTPAQKFFRQFPADITLVAE
jgi:hypothetical protein